MQHKVRIPESPGLAPREPENTRYTFLAVEGKMVMIIELPDGTRAAGGADIDRIDVDCAPSGEVIEMVVSKDASIEPRRRRKSFVKTWEERESVEADGAPTNV